MSKLAEFRQLEKHLAEQLQALENLKGDAGLKKEIEFETKLRDLLAKYSYSPQGCDQPAGSAKQPTRSGGCAQGRHAQSPPSEGLQEPAHRGDD